MSLKVAINGMGVIGREIFRTLYNKGGIEIVCLNDDISPKNLAYLLKYDSVYHELYYKDRISSVDNGIIVDGKIINLYDEKNPSNLPLGELKIDLVLECTGLLQSKEKLHSFINAGARRVIACYSLGSEVPNIVFNVNQDTLKYEDTIICVPEMESQVTASLLKIVNKALTVESGIVKAFRSFTNAQPTMDSYNNDAIRGRSAPVNITPVSDGFAKGVGLVIPDLNGKINGFAYRSPVINGSIMDFTLKLKKSTTSDILKSILKAGSNESIGYNEDALCSSDALSFDAPQMLVQRSMIMPLADGTSLINVSVAYDNIRGYCNQMARFLKWAESPDIWL